MEPKKIIQLAIDQLVLLKQLREVDRESAAVAELAASIGEIGLQQPLTVRLHDGKHILIDGERRYWACRKLGLPTVPVIVEDAELSESEIIRRQLIPNCQRQDLTPAQRARAIDRLMKCTGWNASQAALKLATSNATVTRLLSLLSVPPEVLEMVEAGGLAASAAYEISKIGDPAKQLEAADKAVSGGMTRDAISGAVKSGRRSRPEATGQKVTRATARLGGGRSVTVAATTLDLDALVELLEDLLSKARSARTKGLGISTFLKVLSDQSRH